MEIKFLGGKVVVTVGDITEQKVDAIVNAANLTLLGGGGVDGAIHDKGGAQILEECRKIRQTRFPKGLPTGSAVVTSGGNLKARFVIHTVGPIYGRHGGAEAELLAQSYHNCLLLACEYLLETIAFPSISTGAYGYPKHEAAKVVSAAITNYLNENAETKEIRLVFFSAADARMFVKHQTFSG
jgi:O-acetyl-ADP-ribose deacetylase (regulator of RNase III)